MKEVVVLSGKGGTGKTSIVASLASLADSKVVADCENGELAIIQATELMPDILLADINMSPGNGFEVARYVSENLPSVRVIGLSVNNQPKNAIRMMKLGAKGYLTKSSSLKEINHGINEVHNGKLYICEEVRKHLPPSEFD